MTKTDIKSNLTPMMQQFYSIKNDYPDAILFFRMGDFYEMFDKDAEVASKVLGIALTNRNKSSENSPPMCGIPYHSYQPYLNKLLSAGYKVAICEQLEDPSKAKGIVKRGVTRIITPGTILENEALENHNYNFLLSVSASEKGVYYSAIADASTGDLFLFSSNDIKETITRFNPKEVIGDIDIKNKNLQGIDLPFYYVDKKFHFKTMLNSITEYFNVTSLKALGILDEEYVKPVYFVLNYVKNMLIDVNFKRPNLITSQENIYIDSIAQKTLELFQSTSDRRDATLYQILNKCSTPMGERLLSFYLMTPTNDINEISVRQNLCEFFLNNKEIRLKVIQILKEIYDLERIITRINAKKATPKDLVYLRSSIKPLDELKDLLKDSINPFIKEIFEAFDDLNDLHNYLIEAISDDPPYILDKGGVINDGFIKEIDDLRFLRKNSRIELAKIEAKEKNNSGINTLKIKYNKVFGYYLEVPKSQIKNVPEYFERRQTLVSAERYITEELKELEEKILTADERLAKLEAEIFKEVVKEVQKHTDRIRGVSKLLSKIDVMVSFAEVAEANRYVKPEVTNGDVIKIIDARHPVVERFSEEQFVPNDIFLNNKDSRLMIITGPNMAGKSTYIRTVGIITIMAHIGSFIPAKSGEIGRIDRIFTRIGANDNLSQNESTFMVEMMETGNILNNATENSLIILDEIGRGTSTFDGVSIAWAISEYILNNIKAKTLFATHYHELSDIPLTNFGAKNLTVEVREWNNEIIFLRKIIEGSSDRSYGIYVAKLAGLPKEVLERSYEILSELEKNEFGIDGIPKLAKKSKKGGKLVQPILIFEENEAVSELKKIDINKITPLEALNILAKLKELADE